MRVGRHRYHLHFRLGGEEDGTVVVAPRIWPDYYWTQGGRHCVSPGDAVYCLRMVQHWEDVTDVLLVLRQIRDIGKEDGKCLYERIGSLRLLPGTSKIDGLKTAERSALVGALDKAPVQKLDII